MQARPQRTEPFDKQVIRSIPCSKRQPSAPLMGFRSCRMVVERGKDGQSHVLEVFAALNALAQVASDQNEGREVADTAREIRSLRSNRLPDGPRQSSPVRKREGEVTVSFGGRKDLLTEPCRRHVEEIRPDAVPGPGIGFKKVPIRDRQGLGRQKVAQNGGYHRRRRPVQIEAGDRAVDHEPGPDDFDFRHRARTFPRQIGQTFG